MNEFYGSAEDMEVIPPKIKYKYNEGASLKEITEYINKTYGQHYSQNKIQTTEFVIDAGHGEGFCVGNIMKYAQRYGKKNGHNRDDIMKVIHYAIMLLHVHDTQRVNKNG
jgi:membrane-anchored protein YejM (alkaline phosphatase superfamily)